MQGAVPEAVLRSAAAGQLSLPPAEMLEVLVILTAHAGLGQQARQTLANCPDDSLRQLAADPATPGMVIRFFLAPATRRDSVAPDLIEHPQATEGVLAALASRADGSFAHTLMLSPKVQNSPTVLRVLAANPAAAEEKSRVEELLKRFTDSIPESLDHEAELFVLSHEAEIAYLPPKLIELGPEEEAASVAEAAPEKEERISTLQKLNRMTVSQRVKLAMLGSKEERSILIRDGSRVVFSAVLASSKLSDSEAESIAAMKNVQEGVLREMARTRKFIKNYNVMRALANNPRCPMDISLSLIKNLIVPDLRTLSMNKNIPETVRKVALRNYKEKSGPAGKKSE